MRNSEEDVGPQSDTKEFAESFDRLTHYLFRYPAKFHPPVAKYLLEQFSKTGDRVLDPFCGSGTALVEGARLGRQMYGVDVDPVAAFISEVKSRPLRKADLAALSALRNNLVRRGAPARPPAIPNIDHWFEPHVLKAMCALAGAIDNAELPKGARNFAQAVFLSRIRAWSNADPVPVSGLEVTAHIRAKRADGHFPDVPGSYLKALDAALSAALEYFTALPDNHRAPHVEQADAYSYLRRSRRQFDALITSPPYLSAVDYYRRHTLEMYWLDRALTQDQRAKLRHRYIGQYSVTGEMANAQAGLPLSGETEAYITLVSDAKRARAARHYFRSMAAILRVSARRLREGGRLVLVVGDGLVGGIAIPTGKLLAAEAGAEFEWVSTTRYPLKNRYMTYSRRNGADINYEAIIELRKKG